MSSKPTLRDIAEATGVSTASVSMILNGKSLERFSSQRVASVLAEAERIGYRTPSARCAGKQIAVLSPSVSNPYHTKMITGIDAAAHAAGYHTAIYNTYWNPRTESHLLDTLDYSRVAGIIFAMTPIQTAKVRELSRRVPIVAVGDRVGTGQRLMILEAMKMENNIDSDREGTVKEIKVATGDSVLEGDVLLTIE